MSPELSPARPLTWLGIVRLGLVQAALGAIFVIATSTLNRVMVVELALPAVLPGALIGLHHLMQVLRPALGHGSDVGGRRTPWIIGGMAVLAAGSTTAAGATALMVEHLALGIALAVVAFIMMGVGVGAAGTTLLVLIAKRTAPARRPAAATVTYLMMFAGFLIAAIVARATLDPFSPARLVAVAAAISGGGFLIACLAVLGVEGQGAAPTPEPSTPRETFGEALRQVWADDSSRRFALFIFVSMLAYGGEELLIEPFAGAIFGMTVGHTAGLNGALHFGALIGMVLVGGLCTTMRHRRIGSLQSWMVGGCIASALALFGLGALGIAGLGRVMMIVVFALGIANGGFSIAAVGSMMQRVGGEKAGVRMGLWGASQALAFGGGGLVATILSDTARTLVAWQPAAYALVFACQAIVFLFAAALASRLGRVEPREAARTDRPVASGPIVTQRAPS